MTEPLAGCPTWPEEFAQRYRDAGYWIGETFGRFLTDRAAEHPDRTAIIDGDRRLSYSDLSDLADRLAAGLHQLGIGKQDRVVV